MGAAMYASYPCGVAPLARQGYPMADHRARLHGQYGAPRPPAWERLRCRSREATARHEAGRLPQSGAGPSDNRRNCGYFGARPSHAENFSEKPEKHTFFCLNSATPRRPGGPAPAAIAADHRPPPGGAAGWKEWNSRSTDRPGQRSTPANRRKNAIPRPTPTPQKKRPTPEATSQ
jgi:hypothetical protein